MSVSNGYIGNIAMMYGPKMLNNPEDQSRAASILCFFLVLGVSVGALLSAPILQLLWNTISRISFEQKESGRNKRISSSSSNGNEMKL